jgi:hypothetical protein
MGGGRQPDRVWQYADRNPDNAGAGNKPYVDIFQLERHTGNATKLQARRQAQARPRGAANAQGGSGWLCAGEGGPPCQLVKKKKQALVRVQR